MAFNDNPPNSIQPLSIGNIVSASIQLYRSHFQQYFGVALIATGWALFPFLVIIPIVVFYVMVQSYYALLGILVPAWVVFLCYCSAKYLASSATISRLAMGELTNQPETVAQARRYTNSRTWGFWFVSFLLSLLFLGALMGFYLVVAIVMGVLLATSGGLAALFSGDPATIAAIASDPTPFIQAGLSVLGLLLIFLGVISWLAARFAIPELPLAIEAEVTSTQSLNRCWSLTEKSAWRIFLILFIVGLITIPIQILASILSNMIQVSLGSVFAENSPTFAILSFAISYILGLGFGILLLPLWQSVKAVLYYDLRQRREGLGLQLRDSLHDS